MRAFVLRNGWLWTAVGASLWAAACGSSGSHQTPGVSGRAGSSTAGTGAAGSSSGGDAGKSATGGSSAANAGSSAAGNANGGTAGSGMSGASGQGDSGAAGEGTAATGGEGPPGGAGEGNEGGTGATNGNGGEGGAGAEGGAVHTDKIDLLLVVDNSISMFEKQTLFAAAIPKLVQRLVEPWCVAPGEAPTPAADGHVCPQGYALETPPINDMHVGVITTSLGAHGSHDVCSEEQNAQNVQQGGTLANYDDKGQLLPFVRPSANLPSWNGTGFLNWDPLGRATPVGQNDTDQFILDVRKLIEATDAHGCGYETTLEATYRFLVDPEPPKVIDRDANTNVTSVSTDPSNTDEDVLAQRAAFLRDDSALVIVSLSDEDDCSIDDTAGKQGWVVGYKGGVNTLSFHMPRATAACDTDPNDACCAPCTASLPSSCPADPACSSPSLTNAEDSMNLRCFDQKRRFGIDLLYPVDRYVRGLTSSTVPRRSGGTAPNPLFAGGRDPRLVIFTPIVGVPWQDLARDPSDADHLDLLTTAELKSGNRWQALVGDYAAGTPPGDPFMVASVEPRTGLIPNKNPFTDAPIVADTSTNPQATINGHEQTVNSAQPDDLQFACIFPLGTPVDCSTDIDECDCNLDEVTYNRPLCQPPAGGVAGTTQYFGKAYPGIRHLEVARRLGDKAVVASICPRNTTSSSRDDYGYLPAMRALQTRLSALLGSH